MKSIEVRAQAGLNFRFKKKKNCFSGIMYYFIMFVIRPASIRLLYQEAWSPIHKKKKERKGFWSLFYEDSDLDYTYKIK